MLKSMTTRITAPSDRRPGASTAARSERAREGASRSCDPHYLERRKSCHAPVAMMVSITRAAAMMNKSPAILASSVADMDVVDYLRINRNTAAPAGEFGVGARPVSHNEVCGFVGTVKRNSLRITYQPRMTVCTTHSTDHPKRCARILYLRQLCRENCRELVGRRVAIVEQLRPSV